MTIKLVLAPGRSCLRPRSAGAGEVLGRRHRGVGEVSAAHDACPKLEDLKAEYEWDEAPADLNRYVDTGEGRFDS